MGKKIIPPVSIWGTLLATKVDIIKNTLSINTLHATHIVAEKVDEITDGVKAHTKDVVKTISSDAKLEGKKQGYIRAASEYKKAYKEIEKNYKELKSIILQRKNDSNNKIDSLIAQLQVLEKRKNELEKIKNQKSKDVSNTYNIPLKDIKGAIVGGPVINYRLSGIAMIELIYLYKKKKWNDAEQKGYQEARKAHEQKIKELQEEFELEIKNANIDLEDLEHLIIDILISITRMHTEIAELEILLGV